MYHLGPLGPFRNPAPLRPSTKLSPQRSLPNGPRGQKSQYLGFSPPTRSVGESETSSSGKLRDLYIYCTICKKYYTTPNHPPNPSARHSFLSPFSARIIFGESTSVSFKYPNSPLRRVVQIPRIIQPEIINTYVRNNDRHRRRASPRPTVRRLGFGRCFVCFLAR